MTAGNEVWARVCDDAPPAPAPPAGGDGPIAMIIAHGMGQPVPFQTLEEVVRALREAEVRAGRPAPEVCVRRVELMAGDKLEPFNRAELWLGPKPGSPGPRGTLVHLYEVYWAPIPEGRVTIRDVVSFLLGALWQNRRIFGTRTYWRYVFGAMRGFPIKPLWTGTLLSGVGLVLASLIFINVTVGFVTLMGLSNSGLFTTRLLQALLRDMGLLVAPIGCFLLGVKFVPAWSAVPPSGDPKQPSLSPRSLIAWLFVVLGVLALIAIAVVIGHDMATLAGTSVSLADRPARRLVLGFGLVWLLFVWMTKAVRNVLVQYVGDVAAYVSAHTVNRFWQIRSEVFQAAMRVGRAVYGARVDGARVDGGRADGDRALYDDVVVVGHSLGSLIAYDMVNGLLLEDYLTARRPPQSSGQERKPLGIAPRTAALVTSGSPLDKIAFLFRIQQPMDAVVREVLANSIQPLILHPGFRPRRWVNIHSWNDLISGDLDYYDLPGASKGETPPYAGVVENLYDHAAHHPLVAHNQYWRNPLFGDVLLSVARVHPAEIRS